MMYVHAEQDLATSLTDSSQQMQDMKDKLEDLIPWVTKLKDSLTKVNLDDHEEAERRTQLAEFASHFRYLGPN